MERFSIVYTIIIIIFLVLTVIVKLNLSKIKGLIGELKIKGNLNQLDSGYFPLHNIIIQISNSKTVQIDHVVVSEYGIFVIETKNYKGWIFGNENAEYWKQIIFNNKYSIRNPVKQNWSHVYALKGILSDFSDVKYFPIVVFSGDAVLKSIESRVPVVYEYDLNHTIIKCSTEKYLSAENVKQIKDLLGTLQLTNKTLKKTHIKNIERNISDKHLKMQNLMCPKCNCGLVLRTGKYSKFYGCPNYPKCKFTMKY